MIRKETEDKITQKCEEIATLLEKYKNFNGYQGKSCIEIIIKDGFIHVDAKVDNDKDPASSGNTYLLYTAKYNAETMRECNGIHNIFTDVTPLSTLKLSERTENAIRRAGIESVEELCEMGPKDIRTIRNFGEMRYKEVYEALKKNNFCLGGMPGDTSIDEIGLSPNTYNELLTNGIYTVEKIKKYYPEYTKKILIKTNTGLADKIVKELEEKMERFTGA